MREAILTYFTGEQNAGLVAAIVAFLGLAAAGFLREGRSSLRPLAVTLAIAALLDLALGVGLFVRTGPQVERLIAQLGSEASAFYTAESTRMTRVQRSFVLLEYAWVGLIVASVVAAVALRKRRPALSGVALGLLLNFVFLLAFDLVAERRGATYLAALEIHRPSD